MDFQFVLSAEHTNRHFYGRFKTKFPALAILNILCTKHREPSLNKTKKRGAFFLSRPIAQGEQKKIHRGHRRRPLIVGEMSVIISHSLSQRAWRRQRLESRAGAAAAAAEPRTMQKCGGAADWCQSALAEFWARAAGRSDGWAVVMATRSHGTIHHLDVDKAAEQLSWAAPSE